MSKLAEKKVVPPAKQEPLKKTIAMQPLLMTESVPKSYFAVPGQGIRELIDHLKEEKDSKEAFFHSISVLDISPYLAFLLKDANKKYLISCNTAHAVLYNICEDILPRATKTGEVHFTFEPETGSIAFMDSYVPKEMFDIFRRHVECSRRLSEIIWEISHITQIPEDTIGLVVQAMDDFRPQKAKNFVYVQPSKPLSGQEQPADELLAYCLCSDQASGLLHLVAIAGVGEGQLKGLMAAYFEQDIEASSGTLRLKGRSVQCENAQVMQLLEMHGFDAVPGSETEDENAGEKGILAAWGVEFGEFLRKNKARILAGEETVFFPDAWDRVDEAYFIIVSIGDSFEDRPGSRLLICAEKFESNIAHHTMLEIAGARLAAVFGTDCALLGAGSMLANMRSFFVTEYSDCSTVLPESVGIMALELLRKAGHHAELEFRGLESAIDPREYENLASTYKIFCTSGEAQFIYVPNSVLKLYGTKGFEKGFPYYHFIWNDKEFFLTLPCKDHRAMQAVIGALLGWKLDPIIYGWKVGAVKPLEDGGALIFEVKDKKHAFDENLSPILELLSSKGLSAKEWENFPD